MTQTIPFLDRHPAEWKYLGASQYPLQKLITLMANLFCLPESYPWFGVSDMILTPLLEAVVARAEAG